MGTHLVEMASPRFDHRLGLGSGTKPFQRQALVAEFPVEAIAGAVLPGLARLDQRRLDAGADHPFQQRATDEFRAIAHREWI